MYDNLCYGKLSLGSGTILCVSNEICIIINVNVFYFVFSAVFIGEGQNLTIYFTFWLYVY